MKYSPGILFSGIVLSVLILYGCLIQNISQFNSSSSGLVSEAYYQTICFFGGGIIGIVIVYLIGYGYDYCSKKEEKDEKKPLLDKEARKKRKFGKCSKSPRHALRMIYASGWLIILYVAWSYDFTTTPVPIDSTTLVNRVLSYVFVYGAGGAFVWTNDVGLETKLFSSLVVLCFSYYFATSLLTTAGFLTCYQNTAFLAGAAYFGFILENEPKVAENKDKDANAFGLKLEIKVGLLLTSVYLFHTYAYIPFFTLPGSTLYPITTFQLMSIGLFVGVSFHYILNYFKAIKTIIAFMVLISFGKIWVLYGWNIGTTSDEFYSVAFFYGMAFGYIDSVLLKWTYDLKIHVLWYLIAACGGCATMLAFPTGHDLIIPILSASAGFCALQIASVAYQYQQYRSKL